MPQAEIATQLRVNIKDGGVDTVVGKAIPRDSEGWFAIPTCWQFKAVEAIDIDDKPKKTKSLFQKLAGPVFNRPGGPKTRSTAGWKPAPQAFGTDSKKNALQEEINKPYVRKLIADGYGYRLCLLGDLTPEKLIEDWEAQLKQEVLAINPQAPDPRVVHGGHLLHWAKRFPAIVVRLRNWTQGGFHWDAWQDNCRAVTPTYVLNPEPVWEGLRQQILRHARLSGPSVAGEACLLIGGAAGVGKTRLVFETLANCPKPGGSSFTSLTSSR